MTTTVLSVRRSLTVDAPQQRAFDTFVNLSAWWPLETHAIGEKPARASIVEPRTGGRWYEIDNAGAEHEIGAVLAYEPPEWLLLAWRLSCAFAYDPSMETQVEVRFVAETPNRTRVELEHRGFESYGDNAEAGRDLYDGDGAWTSVLARYVEHLR